MAGFWVVVPPLGVVLDENSGRWPSSGYVQVRSKGKVVAKLSFSSFSFGPTHGPTHLAPCLLKSRMRRMAPDG